MRVGRHPTGDRIRVTLKLSTPFTPRELHPVGLRCDVHTSSRARLPGLGVPAVCLLSVLAVAGCGAPRDEPAPGESLALESPRQATIRRAEIDESAVEQFVLERMEENRIPGVAVAVVDIEGVVFTAGYGWADLDGRVPMTPQTVTNIASISKTITNAAVLQLRDRGRFDLDDDINDHLPFSVRHPRFPDSPITIRQLLTHTAGIDDGAAYEESYACGDPAVALADWIRGYLEPGGAFFDPDQNFLPTAPGEAQSYSNVGFGLLGYLVEVVSGESFAEYTRGNIFAPLGMDQTGWYLSDIAPGRHGQPYAWIEAGDRLDNVLFGERNGEVIAEASHIPFCGYSFYNIPDGLLRTSVDQLARFLIAHMRGGEIDGERILAASTVEEILSQQVDPSLIDGGRYVQGLTWRSRADEVGPMWGHSGADPGVRTRMLFTPAEGIGIIVFANRVQRLSEIVQRLRAEVVGETG